MKPTIAVATILALASTGKAKQHQVTPTETVIVCMDKPPAVPMVQLTVSEIFARVGIAIAWRGAKCPEDGIRVSVQTATPGNLRPGALAYSMPYERVHICVFYDRIHLFGAAEEAGILAYVIVHEITHILQGVATHSAEGVMKAEFTEDDRRRMARREPLEFTPLDLKLIRDGIAGRTRALAGAGPNTKAALSVAR
jgi:hypothetical protein